MKTSYRLILILSVIGFGFTSVFAENVEEVIAKHIKAHGGEKNWNEIKSMKVTGDYTSFSETFPFVMHKGESGKFRNEYQFGMHFVIDGHNGDFGWTDNPWFELPFARKMGKMEAYVTELKYEFCTPFLNYKNRGFKVELLGEEKIDGMDMYKIKLTKRENIEETWYLSKDTYLEYKLESLWSDFGNPSQAETYFDEFQKVGKVMIPHYIETAFGTRHRTTEIQNIEINPQIDESVFAMPKSEEIMKIANLEGDWSVIVETLGRRGWFRSDSTTSCIKFAKSGNLLMEEIELESYFKYAFKFNYSYNNETNKYRMTSFNDLSSTLSVLEGELVDNTLSFDNKGISFEGLSEEAKRYSKIEIKNLNKEGFLVEVSSSRDKGETWNVNMKMNYSRL